MCNNINTKKCKPDIPRVRNEKEKAYELHDDFEIEFDKTLEQLMEVYPRHSRVKKEEDLTENVFKMAIYTVLIATLREMQVDSSRLTIREFHRKYVPNLPILYRYDFTSDEFKQIIDSSYLSIRDKNIAYKFFVEKKNNKEVHNEILEIGDSKTIDNNLPSINDILLHRACLFNKENK